MSENVLLDYSQTVHLTAKASFTAILFNLRCKPKAFTLLLILVDELQKQISANPISRALCLSKSFFTRN